MLFSNFDKEPIAFRSNTLDTLPSNEELAT
jgi:hypothetical protein